MKEINFKWCFWAGVDIVWPGEGVWVWIVPDKSKEWALEEFSGIVDGSDQEPIATFIQPAYFLLPSCDNVFDLLRSDSFLVNKGNLSNLACHHSYPSLEDRSIMEMDLNCLKDILAFVTRTTLRTNLCICPYSVCISHRGYMEVEAINLNELLYIIPDDGWFESIHLCIILEYISKEFDVLEVRVNNKWSYIKQDDIHHQ